MNQSATFAEFVRIIAALRAPITGCPWDREQTHESLLPYLIEETYEVAQSIEEGAANLREELGDLLLQIGLHSQIAAEDGRFTITDVIASINTKLIERHPHVFGNETASTAEEVARQWQQRKAATKPADSSILDGIPKGLPALLKAQQVSKRVVHYGFEWPDMAGIRDQILDEVREFTEAATSPEPDQTAIEDEFGDILFSLIQLARKFNFDAETVLQRTVARFSARFKYMERHTPKPLQELTLDEWDLLWTAAKAAERAVTREPITTSD
jgi:tetrapyrrole methylase family protein/MazG family protein